MQSCGRTQRPDSPGCIIPANSSQGFLSFDFFASPSSLCFLRLQIPQHVSASSTFCLLFSFFLVSVVVSFFLALSLSLLFPFFLLLSSSFVRFFKCSSFFLLPSCFFLLLPSSSLFLLPPFFVLLSFLLLPPFFVSSYFCYVYVFLLLHFSPCRLPFLQPSSVLPFSLLFLLLLPPPFIAFPSSCPFSSFYFFSLLPSCSFMLHLLFIFFIVLLLLQSTAAR